MFFLACVPGKGKHHRKLRVARCHILFVWLRLIGVFSIAVDRMFTLLLTSSCSLLPAGKARVLTIRGGGTAPPASETLPPAASLQLTIVGGSEGPVNLVPRIELSAGNIAALRLTSGDVLAQLGAANDPLRIHITNKNPRKRFFGRVPETALGVATEGPALGAAEIRLPKNAMQSMRMRPGDRVIISPVTQPARGTHEKVVRQCVHRRHSEGWGNSVVRFGMYRSLLAPTVFAGGFGQTRRHSHGHGYRRSHGMSHGRRR